MSSDMPPSQYATEQPVRPRRPQQDAVIALGITLAVLLAIWIVGAFVLIQYAPDLGQLPGGESSPEATPTR